MFSFLDLLDCLLVRIIALSTIKAFVARSAAYADAREPMMAWHRAVSKAD
jgi:mRNA interferase HigB